jgi:hypothetical protein
MTEVERALLDLGRHIRYPPTPPLARTLAERLGAEEEFPTVEKGRLNSHRPRPAALRPRTLALAFALLLALAAGALAASPALRDAVGELLGLEGATVERSPAPGPRGSVREPHLGVPTTLALARRAVSFGLLIPGTPGGPDAVYLRRGPAGGEVSLAYHPRRGFPQAGTTRLGLLVTEFRGDLEPDLVAKIAPAATEVERRRVGGNPAIWISGAPHDFAYRAPDGSFRESSLRLAANVLLVQRGRLLVRIEGEMPLGRALEVARSLR